MNPFELYGADYYVSTVLDVKDRGAVITLLESFAQHREDASLELRADGAFYRHVSGQVVVHVPRADADDPRVVLPNYRPEAREPGHSAMFSEIEPLLSLIEVPGAIPETYALKRSIGTFDGGLDA